MGGGVSTERLNALDSDQKGKLTARLRAAYEASSSSEAENEGSSHETSLFEALTR